MSSYSAPHLGKGVGKIAGTGGCFLAVHSAILIDDASVRPPEISEWVQISNDCLSCSFFSLPLIDWHASLWPAKLLQLVACNRP